MSKRSKWWYVIHGDESVLVHLESNWEQINLQTSWKLEPCFMTESIPGSNAVHDSSDPGYATATTGNDGLSVPKPPTSAPSPTVNLQTPYSVKIIDLDGTLDKCNHESASCSDLMNIFLSIELSDQPPTTQVILLILVFVSLC